MYTNNRRSRRQMAKKFGMFKNQDTLTAQDIKNGITTIQKASSRRERARTMGEQIHLQHLERTYSQLEKAQSELDVRMLNNKVDWYIKGGMSREDAEKKATAERKIEKEISERKESIRFDEKAIRKDLKDQHATKKEIRNALREFRKGLK